MSLKYSEIVHELFTAVNKASPAGENQLDSIPTGYACSLYSIVTVPVPQEMENSFLVAEISVHLLIYLPQF
jgi:hypothetical protein